ncbi:MAG: hypothetical protein DRP93_09030 [Candidatus Neomarinimicrobiota bacterium]|nr:MAG: hypothetical protein DRP93_09030 [Candidatus Neomarinimicrobiota bacterium]
MANFKDIHRTLLIEALAKSDMRLHNKQFTLDIGMGDEYLAINAYEEYYKGFFKWLTSGETHPDNFVLLSDKAQTYRFDYKGRNVSYAPRISKQIGYVVDRLKNRSTSKRASLVILEAGDSVVNEADYKIEYPCTIGYTFFIDNGRVCSTTVMRSNNACSVIGLDVYLGVELLKTVALLLDIEVGTYTHFMIDCHIIEAEIQRAKNYISMEL